MCSLLSASLLDFDVRNYGKWQESESAILSQFHCYRKYV